MADEQEALEKKMARLAAESGPRSEESWREEVDQLMDYCRFLRRLVQQYKSRVWEMQSQLNSDQPPAVIANLVHRFDHHARQRAKNSQ